jgi:hypothetical protein
LQIVQGGEWCFLAIMGWGVSSSMRNDTVLDVLALALKPSAP